MSTDTSAPDSGPGPDGQVPPRARPRMPQPDRTAAGFARNVLSAAWWRELPGRIADLFRGRRAGGRPDPWDSPGPTVLLDSDEPQDSFTLETPALGDAYNFLVSVRCSWCVQATATRESRRRRAEEIARLIAQHRPVIRDRLEDTIRPIARRFPPYRAAEAEKSISKGIGECLSEGDIQVKVRVRVDVCPPVREDLRKIWQERLVEDARGDLKKASVELIGELQECWRDLLLKGLEGIGEVQTAKAAWIAPYALALAQDPQGSASEHLHNMITHRVSHAEGLLTDLGDLVTDQRTDAIEFAFGSDSALRAVLALLGVPIPQRGNDNEDANSSGGTRAS